MDANEEKANDPAPKKPMSAKDRLDEQIRREFLAKKKQDSEQPCKKE